MLGAPSASDTALLDSSNATLISPAFASSLGHAARRLLAGRTVRLFVVGGSASAGRRNWRQQYIRCKADGQIECASRRRRGFERAHARPYCSQQCRSGRHDLLLGVTDGGGAARTQPHLLLWEYSINDHAVSLEAASRISGRGESRKFSDETMRYMLDHWLHRALTLGAPPPALLLAYLWDKQPAAAFKAGNRACASACPSPRRPSTRSGLFSRSILHAAPALPL